MDMYDIIDFFYWLGDSGYGHKMLIEYSQGEEIDLGKYLELFLEDIGEDN